MWMVTKKRSLPPGRHRLPGMDQTPNFRVIRNSEVIEAEKPEVFAWEVFLFECRHVPKGTHLRMMRGDKQVAQFELRADVAPLVTGVISLPPTELVEEASA